MELQINNRAIKFTQEEITIQAMLDIEFPEKQKGIAVAVNTTVIPRSHWNSYILYPHHQILIISATQGG